jgi:hypothetical protein
MTAGLIGSHLRLSGRGTSKLGDREAWEDTELLRTLVGDVWARVGEGLTRCGALWRMDELSPLGMLEGNGGNESSVASGVVFGLVWDLLGPLNGHRRRGPDSPVLDVLCEDEESTLNLRPNSDGGRGGEGEGAKEEDGEGAVEGRGLRFPETEGN